VAKLGRLTSVTTVYRGFRGATLPAAFLQADAEQGFAGGVEFGFSSTTVAREQAVHYATGRASTVFEMRQGMVRGLLSRLRHFCFGARALATGS
jgi:hypothetical protein